MKPLLPALFLALASLSVSRADPADPVAVNWLDGTPPPVPTGISWGIPFPKGAVSKTQLFSLTAADGSPIRLQSWPLAYWPDGSIKWCGFAAIGRAETVGPLKLALGSPPAPAATGPSVKVTEYSTAFDIDTGGLQCRIAKQGPNLFEFIAMDGHQVAANAQLECLDQHTPTTDVGENIPIEKYLSNVKKVTVEQSGPVRAVVKIEGMHKSTTDTREWLPFVVRLYFYAGREPIRMVHTFFFDGDQNKDFIHGLGVIFSVPMREEIQNRHIRFAGEGDGLWAEPVIPLTGYNARFTAPGITGDVFASQVNGLPIPNRDQLPAASARLLDTWASWDDFRLQQPNAQGFTVDKRTNDNSSWLPAGSGKRANGLVFAGDTSGGLGVSLKDFWQTYPVSLEVRHAKADAAEVRVWMWSPDAQPMDLRHYDTVAHGLNESYEDVEIPLATPYGIARTHTLTLFPTAGMPTKEELSQDVVTAAQPPLLVCSPQYLHDQQAFGIWSIQDRSTPFKAAVEDQLDTTIAFYEKCVDQYNWYGFWDFGNVMHSYDGVRHTWRYDVGGFAWDNDEQGTDMLLWYSFLRTGRADIFRLAEAMSRQTGEVDTYHFGPLAGLGSRHNVNPWGDGAKEARIAMAPYRRFYYYLTTDERTGDTMHEMLQADQSITRIDPMRKVDPPTEADAQFPARVRGGPDWFAFVGNWMTEWERTGDPKYRDKIETSIASIAAMSNWFMTSPDLLWGFYPETGKLVPRQDIKGGYNLVNNMGGPEVMFEFNNMTDNETWKKIWLQYCRLSGGNAPAALIAQDKITGIEGANGQYAGGGRLAGYAYYITKNPAYAQRAIGVLNTRSNLGNFQLLDGPSVMRSLMEPASLNGGTNLVTNNANQNSLNMIEVLELCKDQLPTEAPAVNAGRAGGRGARGAPPANSAAPAASN